jgi:hypothetical protein
MPAANAVAAIVTALTDASSGRSSGAITSRPITTDVSSKPLVVSATRGDVLIDGAIEVCAQPLMVNARGTSERRGQSRSVHEAAPHRHQFANRNTIASHDECFALVEAAHDVTAVVAQLALTDLAAHAPTVAHVRHQ